MGNQAGRQEETESGLLLVSWFTSASHLCVSFVFSVKKKKQTKKDGLFLNTICNM